MIEGVLPPFDPDSITTTEESEQSTKKEELVEKGREEGSKLDQRLAMVEKGIRNQGLSEYFKLRSKWSTYLLRWITALIVFNCILTIFVGIGWFDFTDYQWFVTAVLIETFLQIVGLGFVAMKFLFSDPKQ